MSDGNAGTAKEKTVIGLAVGAFGLYIVLVGLRVLPVPGGDQSLHAPFWVAVCAGFVFLLAGLNVFVQGIGRANANAELPADAPAWMAAVQYGSVPALLACLAATGTWIAFAPGERVFSDTLEAAGADTSALVGRIVFGTGAVIVWLCALIFAVSGWRRFRKMRARS